MQFSGGIFITDIAPDGRLGTVSFVTKINMPHGLKLNDFYNTPWGPMYRVGYLKTEIGPHGWNPKHIEESN